MKEFYSVKEVAQIFNLTTNSIYYLLRTEKLEGCRVGGGWRIHKSVIEKLIQGE